ncbi:MAG: hemerythrin domain-containing protein [Deltaproteobacteria bacterium]|jgi:hemerythrin-like domain-containing protein|nr:hemerythrin domain-containing protein [Deltaproteobacteria bacterium]
MDASHDPLAALRIEHEEIRSVLNKLDGYLKKTTSAGSDEDRNNLINRLSEIIAFMDKDLEIHFKREEEALFPVLGNYIGIETGPINVMIIEHNHCRDLSTGFKSKINDYPSSKDYKSLIGVGSSLSQLLSEHEDKEDNILFNMAEMHLTPDEKRNIMEKILTIK